MRHLQSAGVAYRQIAALLDAEGVRVRSRNREETRVMECLYHLLKSLRRDEVMLFAGDSATAEALIVDMAPAPEIDSESHTTDAERVAFRVRENDVVELGLLSASDQGYYESQFQQHPPRHIPDLKPGCRLWQN